MQRTRTENKDEIARLVWLPVIMLSLVVHVVVLFGKFWRDGYLMSLYEEYKQDKSDTSLDEKCNN